MLLAGVGMYFSAFHFNFKALTPYHKLHRTVTFQQAMSVLLKPLTTPSSSSIRMELHWNILDPQVEMSRW